VRNREKGRDGTREMGAGEKKKKEIVELPYMDVGGYVWGP
jgi:hypothetical protein